MYQVVLKCHLCQSQSKYLTVSWHEDTVTFNQDLLNQYRFQDSTCNYKFSRSSQVGDLVAQPLVFSFACSPHFSLQSISNSTASTLNIHCIVLDFLQCHDSKLTISFVFFLHPNYLLLTAGAVFIKCKSRQLGHI